MLFASSLRTVPALLGFEVAVELKKLVFSNLGDQCTSVPNRSDFFPAPNRSDFFPVPIVATSSLHTLLY